jgi:hypothetical protein
LEEEETMEWWASNEEFEFNTGKVEDIRGWQEERQERIQLLAGLGIQREN